MTEKIKMKHPNFRVLEGALQPPRKGAWVVPCVQWVAVHFTMNPATPPLQTIGDKTRTKTQACLLYAVVVLTVRYSNIPHLLRIINR